MGVYVSHRCGQLTTHTLVMQAICAVQARQDSLMQLALNSRRRV